MNVYSLLLISIVLEVAGTSLMPTTAGMTRLKPSLLMLACYASSFFLLTRITQVLPTSIVYAIWSSLGIVLTTAIGVLFLRQKLDMPALVGLSLILLGVLVLRTYSNAATHT